MPTYRETVEGLFDVWAAGLDELTGTAMSAWVGPEGTYRSSGITLGIASPIETDPSSRAVGGRVGTVAADDVTGDFTWNAWGYSEHDSLQVSALLTRNGQNGLSGGNWLMIDDDEVFCMVTLGGTSYTLSGSIPLTGWYMATVTRSSTVLRLYINGRLVAQNNSVDAGAVSGAFPGVWEIGSQASGTVNYGVGTDCPAIAAYALSASEVLTVYEAARARLPMYATITMRTSVVADLTPPPTYEAYQLRHNWANPVVERLSRLTDIRMSNDGTEERAGAMTRTRRRYSIGSLVPDAVTQRQFNTFLRSNLRKPVVLPLLTDTVKLQAAVSAGATVLSLDCEHRAFDVGSRIIIATDEQTQEVAEIVGVDNGAGEITLADPLENDWPLGAKVNPAKLSYLEQEVKPVSHTRDVQTVPVTASVLVQEIPASPNDITAFTPDTTYLGVEVFDPYQWGLNDYGQNLEHSIEQISDLIDLKTGVFSFDSDVTVARDGIGYSLLLKGREQISLFRGWFEARAGRLNKLWVPTFIKDLGDIVTMDGNPLYSSITISGHHYTDNFYAESTPDEHRRDVCLIQRDQSMLLGRISTASPSGANDDLIVNLANLHTKVSTTRFICFLRMMRLDADEIELAWQTSDTVRVSLRFRELLNEP